MPDVYKILKDLELKAVGLDPDTQKMQEGYFVAFRSAGLPIHKEDYRNPWSPFGAPHVALPPPPNTPPDPKDVAPVTTSSTLDTKQAQIDAISESMRNYVNTFLLLDDKLQMNNMYSVMPGSSKVSDSWFAIIHGANGIPSTSQVSPTIKAAVDAARAVIQAPDGSPTPKYNAYLQYQDDYNAKRNRLNREFAAAFTDPVKLNSWPIVGAGYQDEKNEAYARWTGLGFKNEIDAAMATLAAQGVDPSMLLIKRGKEKYENSLFNFVGLGNLPYTLLSPATWYDPDGDGWTTYTSKEFNSQSTYTASSTSYGGGGGFNLGLWRAGGDFSTSTSQEAGNYTQNNLTVSFSYCTVDIRRPWLDTSLLNLPNWFLVGDYKKGCISTGKMAQQLPTNGVEPAFLPSLVTSLILVKDLTIAWDHWQSDWSNFKSSTSASASVGWGPFSVSGHYSQGSQQRSQSAEERAEGLFVEGVQLVGYVSTINPLSPQKDSAPYMAQPNQ